MHWMLALCSPRPAPVKKTRFFDGQPSIIMPRPASVSVTSWSWNHSFTILTSRDVYWWQVSFKYTSANSTLLALTQLYHDTLAALHGAELLHAYRAVQQASDYTVTNTLKNTKYKAYSTNKQTIATVQLNNQRQRTWRRQRKQRLSVSLVEDDAGKK